MDTRRASLKENLVAANVEPGAEGPQRMAAATSRLPRPGDDFIEITRAGTRPVTRAPAQNFTGVVKVEMLYSPVGPERASAGTVSFSPGARTAWRSHPLGQTLVVTAGIGRVQRWSGPVEQISAGDVVHIPANVKHWHGAAADSAMAHIAITEALGGKAVEWMEQVDDASYRSAPAQVPVATSAQANCRGAGLEGIVTRGSP